MPGTESMGHTIHFYHLSVEVASLYATDEWSIPDQNGLQGYLVGTWDILRVLLFNVLIEDRSIMTSIALS